MYSHLFIRFYGYLLVLRTALYSNCYGAYFRVKLLGTLACVKHRGKGWVELCLRSSYLFTFFSGKIVPLPHLPNPHSLWFVLFCYIYYFKYINFDAMLRDFSRSMIFTTWRNAAQCHSISPTVSLPPQSVSLLSSLSYSEGTSGGLSCNVSRHYVHDRSWSFLTIIEMTIIKMIISDDSRDDDNKSDYFWRY